MDILHIILVYILCVIKLHCLTMITDDFDINKQVFLKRLMLQTIAFSNILGMSMCQRTSKQLRYPPHISNPYSRGSRVDSPPSSHILVREK